MKYVLLILDPPAEPAPGTPEYNSWYAEVGAWYEKWGATGKLDGGHQLQPPATAKTVRAAGVTGRFRPKPVSIRAWLSRNSCIRPKCACSAT